jgi:hypothetical protein
MRMQVEDGVDGMLISICMGYDPVALHVKMTSPISSRLSDNQCRYLKIELLKLRQSRCLECCLSVTVLQGVVAELRSEAVTARESPKL